MRALLFAAVVSFVGLPTTVLAQEPPQLAPVDHEQVLSSNLIGIVAQWFNAEYERKAGSATTVGISGSIMTIGDGDGGVRRANVFLRFYPQGAALSGIYIGMRGGFVWNTPYARDDSAIAAGVEIGRTRLLGAKKNIAISTGFGLDRAWYGGQSLIIPNLRLFNVGIAF